MNRPKSLFLTEESLGIVTDLYQLTMAAGYFDQKMQDVATFELFVRHLPKNRSYLITAGLEEVLHYLTHIKFSTEAVKFIRELPAFNNVSNGFFEYLKNFTFSGTVYAIPEGNIAFADEPLIRVSAPIIETQIIETYLLSTINFQTSIATKASRVVYAAKSREVIDFGTRRAHGPQAGVLAARASFIGGCNGTSNVFAAYELGIPAVGTIAHSWVMAFENEQDSFYKFHEVFPDDTTLLIDTYDTLVGAKHAAMIGKKLKGVRIDSGDLTKLSKDVRKILDTEGLQHVKIVASGDLNEDRIDDLLRKGALIDSFGVGTEMVTSKDAPALGGIYKLVEQEYDGKSIPRMKFSEDKLTYPCKKQVYRTVDREGNFMEDVIGLEGEKIGGIPLLIPVMKEGKICYTLPTIYEIQRTASDNLAHLPEPFRRLKDAQAYPVIKSQGLEAKRQEAERVLRSINMT
ncbi:MAG TPA: nicotinate phosphoribosyltransferase [Candidatus Brocadiaceae bacterium]|nr:MAG: nicotinate phosphoribosyltransferase [Planctomycetes bacterium GWA2_39_15]OHB40485.1 MAG: nicotinate phosphoribosyltransferase [Planctomycetes bacterium GWC2_39_26]